MPIKIADGLDAVSELKKEGIVTIGEKRARTQDIRPLHILILNLMPIKKPTEVQLLRLLGDTPFSGRSRNGRLSRFPGQISVRP